MPDQRRHRGPHPQDREIFGSSQHPDLRAAVSDLSWLLSRGYADPSALKLIGDRYTLTQRQRTAAMRCSCSDQAMEGRRRRQVPVASLAGQSLWLDGYNVLTSVETALSGGAVFIARDGCWRDMASMHGTFRTVAETAPAAELVGRTLAGQAVADAVWFLDSPVSNSGRLKGLLERIAGDHRWTWTIELVANPDAILASANVTIATADSAILDRCRRWTNLVAAVIATHVPGAWVVDLS